MIYTLSVTPSPTIPTYKQKKTKGKKQKQTIVGIEQIRVIRPIKKH